MTYVEKLDERSTQMKRYLWKQSTELVQFYSLFDFNYNVKVLFELLYVHCPYSRVLKEIIRIRRLLPSILFYRKRSYSQMTFQFKRYKPSCLNEFILWNVNNSRYFTCCIDINRFLKYFFENRLILELNLIIH